MADWDDEKFEPEAVGIKKEQSKGLWGDEDAEEYDVKDSWEDDENNSANEPRKESVAENKTKSKSAKADTGKKEYMMQNKTIGSSDGFFDPVADKHHQQRLVEEADFKSTTELFSKRGDEKSLDSFIPKSENDFMEYAELLSHKIRACEKSYYYIGLLKNVMRLSMTSLKAADAKDIASTVAVIANEKHKAEKEGNAGKKKQGAKKKQLHVDKPDDDMVSAAYADAADDYDFM